MAVFTEVTPDEAQRLLSELHLGQLSELRGIEGGIENTNYSSPPAQALGC
jgi:homoserine kinase type II